MKSVRILLVLTAIFLAQPVIAQSGMGMGSNPLDGIQAQIDALAAEVLALHDPSVAGRMYCRIRSDTILLPDGQLNTGVRKHVWSFDLLGAGTFTADPVSIVDMTQGPTGPTTRTGTVGGAQQTHNYAQNGNSLTITFVSGNVAELVVSGDGSLAYGWFVGGLAANVQLLNVLVEISSPAECVANIVTNFP